MSPRGRGYSEKTVRHCTPACWATGSETLKKKENVKDRLGAVVHALIPAPWEAEVCRSRGQKFKTSLASIVKPHLYLKYKKLAGRLAGACNPSYLGG